MGNSHFTLTQKCRSVEWIHILHRPHWKCRSTDQCSLTLCSVILFFSLFSSSKHSHKKNSTLKQYSWLQMIDLFCIGVLWCGLIGGFDIQTYTQNSEGPHLFTQWHLPVQSWHTALVLEFFKLIPCSSSNIEKQLCLCSLHSLWLHITANWQTKETALAPPFPVN